MNWVLYIVVLLCAVCGASAQLFLKQGVDTLNIIKISFGVALYGVAFIGFTTALRFGQLSKLYPIIATSYILVLILSAIFLKESVTLINYIGAGIIVLGVALTQL